MENHDWCAICTELKPYINRNRNAAIPKNKWVLRKNRYMVHLVSM